MQLAQYSIEKVSETSWVECSPPYRAGVFACTKPSLARRASLDHNEAERGQKDLRIGIDIRT